jgi:5-methylcytosine-specific restriction endonuclease McrA
MDTKYARKQYQDFRDEKDAISLGAFGGRCFLCGDTEGYQFFHLHHIDYDPLDSSYKRNSKAQWTRRLRVREATLHPERFRLLCPKCHRLVTSVGTYFLRRLEVFPNVDPTFFFELALLELKNRQALELAG